MRNSDWKRSIPRSENSCEPPLGRHHCFCFEIHLAQKVREWSIVLGINIKVLKLGRFTNPVVLTCVTCTLGRVTNDGEEMLESF